MPHRIAKLSLFTLLLVVVLSSCNGVSSSQVAPSATQEIDLSTASEVFQPTVDATASPIPEQTEATLSPLFDLARTEDNPITDAAQIIAILEALEEIERAQPVTPGWYLRGSIDLTDPEQPINYGNLFHVINDGLDCDLAMHFMLTQENNILGFLTRNYGTPIFSLSGGEVALMEGAGEAYYCNLSNPQLSFYSTLSNEFSEHVQGWPGYENVIIDGDFSYSAWFEIEQDQALFVLQEVTDNIQSGYAKDPDTGEMIQMESEVTTRAYSIETGKIISFQYIINFRNNKTKTRSSLNQTEYYEEMDDLPPAVLGYLEECLRLYDELQLP